MSYVFERSSGSLAGRALTGAGKVEDKKDDPGASGEIAIVIFTEPGEEFHSEFAAGLADRCMGGGLSVRHLELPLIALKPMIEEMRAAGEIGDGTQVIVNMHGGWKNETHAMGNGLVTTEFVKALREPLEKDGKPCAANIYIASCYAGDNRMRGRYAECSVT